MTERSNSAEISSRFDGLRQDEYKLLESIPKELLYSLLDNHYECLILVDSDGIVRFMSSANKGIYPVGVKETIGKHITEVSSGTRLPLILKTGRAEIGESMILKGKQRIIARIPIVRDGRTVGVAGKLLFLYPDKLKELYIKISSLKKHLRYYESEFYKNNASRYAFNDIISESELLLRVKAMAQKAAKTESPVIIVGESGTGKELFAHAIHNGSKRSRRAFVKINCAAIPHELIESELFGYEQGAFTDAKKSGKLGKFELAQDGTLFLDEIGDMPLVMQAKLLRVLQDKEIEKIGANFSRRVDFRVVAATNRNLEELVNKGEFRLDLFCRINVMMLKLPAIRQIRDDIPLLVHHFLQQFAQDRKKEVATISEEVMMALKNYAWPGNVRELRNVIERSLIVCETRQIELKDLPTAVRESSAKPDAIDRSLSPLRDLVAETERRAIAEALKITANNKVKAAALLGLHRTSLYQKIEKYRLP